MRLFDTFVRTRRIPVPRSTTHFEGLNECADAEVGYVREFVEEWFQHLPEAQQRDLYPRLTSKDNQQHQAALFELYVHELLRKMGYEVEHHPAVEGTDRRPDFLALRNGERLFYLEAVSVHHPEALTKEEKRLADVYDALNGINCPNFWLSVRQSGRLEKLPKLDPLCRKVETWVGTLSPDEAMPSRRARPSMTWAHGEWALEIEAIPKPIELRGKAGSRPVGTSSGRFSWIIPEEGILKALRRKAGRYGDPGLPFVIAVNMLDDCRRGIDAWTGLRRAWSAGERARDRHVSAALMCWVPVALAACYETPYLVHHPSAVRPLPRDWWALPQHAITDESFVPLAQSSQTAPALLGLQPPRSYEDLLGIPQVGQNAE